ncbi:MAG: LysR family transcriptional regulator [Anaerobutyricum soehngenii]
MNLFHLRYFETLARTEHYSKAAEILSITQPSLSYAISTLESELGIQLFEKRGRNIVLTKYGKAFYSNVKEILASLDNAVRDIKLVANGEGRNQYRLSPYTRNRLCSNYRKKLS